MNRRDEGQQAAARQAVLDTARGLVACTIPFLEGVRQLTALRSDVSRLDHDPDFMLFVGIDSESDHLPPREIRDDCAPAWLAQCDSEARELEALHREQVRLACARLIVRFSS